MFYLIRPDFALPDSTPLLADDSTLVQAIKKALELSPISRAQIEEVKDK